MSGHVHVIGGGLAGLSCAVKLAKSGRRTTVYEAAARAGGRCRSFHDEKLGCVIDNGNHLMLSGNHALMAYLGEIGAADRLVGPDRAAFPFLDLETGDRWTLMLDEGRFQRWVFRKKRRVPGTGLFDYLSFLKLMTAGRRRLVSDVLDTKSVLYRRFWEPLIVSALNTAPDVACADLLRPVLAETFLKGGRYCRPLMARESLDHSLVEPALTFLEQQRAQVLLSRRVTALQQQDGRITAIKLGDQIVSLETDDHVVLAVPLWIARQLLPDCVTPDEGEAIVNVHYRLPERLYADPVHMIGLVGGLVHWVFVRGEIASVTISAADALAQSRGDEIAAKAWADVAKALRLEDSPLPPYRVIKEKRATFAATCDANGKRSGPDTKLINLALAGDWTDTNLPATIEGAIRSGHKAAEFLAKSMGKTGRSDRPGR